MSQEMVQLREIPSPTPQLTQSLSPQEVEEHRARLAFEVEIVLQGYWQSQLSPQMKGAVLADWCDELEDWPQDAVRRALRKWRAENASKKPNPGHIAGILKAERGAEYAATIKKPPPKMSAVPSDEQRKKAEEYIRQAGIKLRKDAAKGGAA